MNDEELMEMEIENLTQACDVLQNRIKELEQINEEHRKINGQLRKNWNSLREWLENEIKRLMNIEQTNNVIFLIGAYDNVLDKMNELEGKDK